MKKFTFRVELEFSAEDSSGALGKSAKILGRFRRHLGEFAGDWRREIAERGEAPTGGVTGEVSKDAAADWRAVFEIDEVTGSIQDTERKETP